MMLETKKVYHTILRRL